MTDHPREESDENNSNEDSSEINPDVKRKLYSESVV